MASEIFRSENKIVDEAGNVLIDLDALTAFTGTFKDDVAFAGLLIGAEGARGDIEFQGAPSTDAGKGGTVYLTGGYGGADGDGGDIVVRPGNFTGGHTPGSLRFFDAAGLTSATRPAVDWSGESPAIQSLCAALAHYGLITDGT